MKEYFPFLTTPYWKAVIESELSVKERKLLASMRHANKPLSSKEISEKSRLEKSYAASLITRLLKKGWLARKGRSAYIIKNDACRQYLRDRLGYNPRM